MRTPSHTPPLAHCTPLMTSLGIILSISIGSIPAGAAPVDDPYQPVNPLRSPADTATVFDFVDRLPRGHVRVDGLVIDFGDASHHKYIFGDWQRAWRDAPHPDADYTMLVGNKGTLQFFATPEEAGGGTIGIVGRAARAMHGEIRLNGEPVGTARFSQSEFSYAEVSFGAGLTAGKNRIDIIPQHASDRERRDGEWLDIRLVRIASEGAQSIDGPTSRTQPIRRLEMRPDGVQLPEGSVLTYHLLDIGATDLVLDIACDDGRSGQLEVEVVTDAGDAVTLTHDPAENGIPFELRTFAASDVAATVSFRATLGDVVIRDARLVRDAEADAPMSPPPVKNVLLMVVDTLRADRLRLYNRQSPVATRHIDQLARSSVVFERATAQGNWTKPSVATLLSGLFPTAHGAYTHKSVLDSGIATAPTLFHENGLRTTGFVANGYISKQFGFGQGWDRFEVYPRKNQTSRSGNVLRDVAAWMSQRDESDRFFTYVHTVDPHAPYAAPKPFWSRYDHSGYRGIVRPRQTATLLNRIKAGAILLQRLDIRRLKALYSGEITYHDEVFGTLLGEMKRQRLFKDTVVIITSDHGEEFLDHGSVGHGHSLYEELLHVPLIVRLPDGFPVARRRVSAEVGLVDILPTLCDLLQTPCPREVQGRSLVPLVTGIGQPPASPVVSEFPNERQYAVRTAAYKALFYGFDAMLFAMAQGGVEDDDVSADHQTLLMAMTDSLGEHLAKTQTWGAGRNILSAPKTDESAATIDADTQARLQALGYMGD